MNDHTRTLLATFAHPDDESFGPGGTLARYAGQGVSVHLVCATRGEVGEVDPALLAGHANLAELRTHELECAASILGLAGVHFMGYRDSGMPGSTDNNHPNALFQAPLDEVAGRIVRLIRQLRPQVVITFDPFGGYGHPDHIKIHQATVAAFRAAGDVTAYAEQLANGLEPWGPQKLYYTTFPHTVLRWAIRLMPVFGRDPTAFGANHDINLKAIAERDQPVSARIDVSYYLAAKQRAGACHRSQSGPSELFDQLPRWLVRRMLGSETFYRAYPPADGRETDLFAGVS
jgi:LmbE family N-acetylglucosaminyl deacetylase